MARATACEFLWPRCPTLCFVLDALTGSDEAHVKDSAERFCWTRPSPVSDASSGWRERNTPYPILTPLDRADLKLHTVLSLCYCSIDYRYSIVYYYKLDIRAAASSADVRRRRYNSVTGMKRCAYMADAYLGSLRS